MNRQLGKLAPALDDRTLKLARYMRHDLALPPAQVNRLTPDATWPLYMNDVLGDCTIAAAGHLQESWKAAAQNLCFAPSDADVLAAYKAVGGYVEGRSSTDNGAAMLDVLKYWKRTGIGEDQIEMYAAIDPRNPKQLRQAIYLFGGVYLGLALPLSAQEQEIWDIPSSGLSGAGTPGSWGGHCVCLLGYDEEYLTIISWGEVLRMHWGFLAYADEAYVAVSPDFIGPEGTSPTGLDLVTMQADLRRI